MKQALMVIDVQNDYFEGGAMALVHPEQALHHIQQLERWFLAQNLPIIYIQHINSAQASFFVPIPTAQSYIQIYNYSAIQSFYKSINPTAF